MTDKQRTMMDLAKACKGTMGVQDGGAVADGGARADEDGQGRRHGELTVRVCVSEDR